MFTGKQGIGLVTKKVWYLLLLNLVSLLTIHAQTTGDYRSAVTGNWGTLGTWQRWDGGAWAVPTTGQGYPGQNSSPNLVTIQSNHAITQNVSPAFAIVSLGFSANLLSASLTINSGNTLNVSGAVAFTDPTLNAQNQTIAVNGAANFGSVTMANTTNNTRLNTITVATTGTLGISGNITTNGAVDENFLTLNGNATFNMAGTFTGGTFALSPTSTVNWNGDNANSIRSATYGNLIVSIPASAAASRTKSLAGNVTVQAVFTVQSLHTIQTVTLNTAQFNFTVTGSSQINDRGQFADNNNTGTNIFTGAVSVASNGIMSSANTSAVSFGGNITNNGSISLSANTTTLNGASMTLSGSGNYTFQNLTLSTTGSNNVSYTGSGLLTVNGALTFSTNGLLIISSTNNAYFGSNATFSGHNSSRYIRFDDTNSSTGQLIKYTGNNTNDWRRLYPIGTATGGYTPLDLSAATLNTAPTNGSALSIKSIYKSSLTGELRRVFRFQVSGNSNATTLINGSFYYNAATDVSTSDGIGNYNTIWFLDLSSGGWNPVTGTAPGSGFFTGSSMAQSISNGTFYYTIGTPAAYPNTWYTYQDGNWSNADVWTLDPSGTTLLNPLAQSPAYLDEIVILNGYTVSVDVDGLTLGTTTIQGGGVLDIFTSVGHDLGTVSGTGLLKVKSSTLPSGIYAAFVAPSGGTIEYYDLDGGGPLSAIQTTYNKLKFTNSTNANTVFVTASNLVVNGTLDIAQLGGSGTVTWQINNAAHVQRTISVAGDLTVSNSGQIRVGTGNSGTPHLMTVKGNITNNGSVKFFDATDASFSETNYNNGNVYTTALRGNTVVVTFSGVTNNALTCNNTTDFYRLILNKGTGQQAVLTVDASSTTNMRLFGPAHLGSSGTAPNEISENALSLINGTMRLTGHVSIPRMCQNGTAANDYFSIPQNARLWLNGANVSVIVASNQTNNDDQRLMLDGTLRVTNGTMHFGDSKGLGSGSAGVFIMEGGTVSTWQFRARGAGTGIFAYKQTGGTFNVGYTYAAGGGTDGGSDARFDLSSPSSSFEMTGGTLNIAAPTAVGGNGLFIASSAANYSVSGGTVNFYAGASSGTNNNTFQINSTAPFYNATMNRLGGSAALQLITNGLVILNNLTIVSGNTPIFSANNLSVTVGGNFDIQANTTYMPGTGTTTFNGAGNQSWTHNGTISALSNVVVNKSAGTLTLAGSSTFPNITGGTTGLAIYSGTINDGGKTLTVTGAMSNSGTHTGSGHINLNGATLVNGNNGTFGTLRVQTDGTITVSGKQTITGNLRLTSANSSLNIGLNNLAVLGTIYSDNAETLQVFGTTKRIITSGQRNDGGLTRKATSGLDLLFPLGTGIIYTPVTINATATIAGQVTVRPVASRHPNVTSAGQSVQYYWKVTSTGFTGLGAVTHKVYTYSSATRDAASTTYRPARYNPTNFTWAYGPTFNATAGVGLTQIPTFNTGTSWTPLISSQLDGEYTAGNVAAFGSLIAYYSRINNGNWSTASTWSNDIGRVSVSSTVPCATCPVIIGNGSGINHTVIADANNITCGSLQIAANSTLDCGVRTGLNFGVNTNEVVSGNGILRINVSGGPVFPNGDFKDFIGSNGGTVVWYGTDATAFTLPASGPSVALGAYYNLIVSPFTGQTITLPLTSLTIYNNLTTSGNGTTATNVAAAHVYAVNGNLSVSSGTLQLSCNSAATSTSFAINGNTTVASGASMVVQNANTGNHSLTTSGSFTNNGIVNFRQTAARYLNLIFTGASNTSLTGSNGAATTTLNALTVNKGVNQTPVLTIDQAGTVVNGLASGWLTISNGTTRFNKASSSFTLINSGATTFSIPATACLSVATGTVNVTTSTNNGSDLLLTGKLQVSGGSVNIGTAGTTFNNDIEYASAGNPVLEVSGGSLYVNGAVRRSVGTISGGLAYNQSGGTVTIGGQNTTANNTRGVFEIDYNLGSNFTMSGTSLLQVLRPNGGSNYADLYINPISASVASTSTIEMGQNTTAQSFSYNVKPTLGNFTVIGGSGVQTVTLYSNPMVITGNLSINNGATLNTNTLDVTLAGNMTINGTYNGSENTTTFNGSAPQSAALSSSSLFQNITVNNPGASTISLSGISPTIINLNILSGILDVGSLGLTVNGNVVNNSSQIGTGSIVLSGISTSQTITSNNGVFTNLTLGGSAPIKTIYMDGNMMITGTLTFSAANRYLAIGDDLLTFGTGALISGAGATAFIRPNGVSSDLGITKNWSLGSSSFTYAIGSLGNYSPVTMSLTVTTAGSLNILPINDRHPTYNVGSSERILGTYWIVKRDGTLQYNVNGLQTYSYPTPLMAGSGGALIAAYLNIANPTGWVTSGHGGTANATTMTFTNQLDTNLPAINSTYHFSVGTVNTLPDPLVPVFSRLTNANVSNISLGGSWFDTNSWTTSPDGYGAPLSNPPFGVPVVILNGARINMVSNGRIAFSTTINGLLVIGNYVGHNLGILAGTGTMRSNTNTLPAGNYTGFVASSNGTIEYIAPLTMNNRGTYNNLMLSGTGTVTMTNTDLTLNGNLTIGSGVNLNNNVNNRNITLSGNWSSSGSFTPGTGTVTFNGVGSQSVTGTNSFNNLNLQNGLGSISLAGAGAMNLSNTLTLTNCHLITSSSHQLNLGSSAVIIGGSLNSYISGPLTKNLNASESFTFPIGNLSAGRFRQVMLENTSDPDTWSLQYFANSPTIDGYSASSVDGINLTTASSFEYWLISRSGTSSADLSLSYNTGSYTPPNIGDLDDLRIARWDGAQWDIPPGGGVLSTSGDNISGAVKVTNVTNFSPFTLGSVSEGSPVPVTLLYFKGFRESSEIVLVWQTASELDNERFEVERSLDGIRFDLVGSVAGNGTTSTLKSYNYIDQATHSNLNYYYRLRQVDYDGDFEYSNIIFIEAPQTGPLQWRVYPVPMQDRLTVEVLNDPLNQPYIELVIHDISGQILFSEKGAPKELMPDLNDQIKVIIPGIYILTIVEQENRTVFRLLKN